MSLNWNVTKCDQNACWKKDKDGDHCMTPMCEGLIWTTMLVEMGEITEPKLEEFVWRMNFANKYVGGILQKDKKGTPYTEEDLKPFVGLSTNVLTKTRKQWLKHTIENMEREHNARERNRREEAAKGGAA